MKSTRCWILWMSATLVASTAVAQSLPSAPVQVAVTYDTLHTNHITGQNFWMQGGAVELAATMYGGLGIAARVEGMHAGAASPVGEPLSLVTAVFGPRYTVESGSRRYALFGEALVGESNGFRSLFSVGSGPVGAVNTGTTSSSNALAVDVGGGLDLGLRRHLSIRVLRASYLRTLFPNTTSNVQNSLSIGSGIVINFGR